MRTEVISNEGKQKEHKEASDCDAIIISEPDKSIDQDLKSFPYLEVDHGQKEIRTVK